MKFKSDENIEDWFFKRKQKDFPNGEDYITRYKHIKDVIRNKIQDHIMVGATLSDAKKEAQKRRTLTGHDPKHFQQVLKLVSDLINTHGKTNELSAYEVFFLLVAIQVHDIGNILDRDNHDNSLFEVFNDLFGNDISIDSVEKNIYLNIASAHSGAISGNKDKIRQLFETARIHHHDEEIKVRYLAALLRFADELADTPERALTYLYEKGVAEKGSEIFHQYANSLTSTVIKHNESSININYRFTKQIANQKFQKGNQREYLLDEIFKRIVKLHHEKIYCQKFFPSNILLEHVNIEIKIFSDDHVNTLAKIKLRLIEQGYPEFHRIKIQDICEDPKVSLKADNNRTWSGKVLKDVIK